MIQIRIPDEDFLKCHNFAEICAKTCLSNYKRRGQGNLNKIVVDIHTGKLLEIAAYRLLKKIGEDVIFPDFTIYESKGKSWDADIVSDKYNFHCKSQTEDSVKKYGLSWILQYGGAGKGHTDKLFHFQGKNDYLIPGYISGRSAIICGIFSIMDIMENGLIGLPKLPQLYGSKRAIYWSDLKAHYTENERWGQFLPAVQQEYGENNEKI